MKKHLTILSLIFSAAGFTQMQTLNFEWVVSMGDMYPGNSNPDEGHAICTDAHGNTYTTGYFSYIADFNAGTGVHNLTSNGSYDMFIVKSDAAGNFKWAKSFGSPSSDLGTSVAYDDHGCIYITGGFAGLVDFDDGPGSTLLNAGSDRDIFVQKMDTLGNVIWTKSMTGTTASMSRSYSMDVNYANNAVFISGYFENTVDFNPGAGNNFHTAMGGKDIFIQKLDLLGNQLWTKSFGNTGNEIAYSITSDQAGNVYITGEYEGTIDFDPGLGVTEMTSNGGYDSFILKLDSNGELVWVKSIGGTDWDLAESINLDASGNIYITGSFSATTDFDPNAGVFEMTSTSFTDVFMLKLNNAGDYVWAKTISDGEDDDYGKSTVIDSEGYLYTTGYFNGTSDFDPNAGVTTLTAAGSGDMFIQKMDSMGNFVWATSFGGIGSDWGKSIALDPNKNICLTGFFRNTVDFDPGIETANLTANEYSDIFVLKLNQDTNYLSIASEPAQAEETILFPNPATEMTRVVVPDAKNTNVVVYDLSGKIVSTVNVVSGSGPFMMDVSAFDAGTYLVAITNEQGIRTEKLVVSH